MYNKFIEINVWENKDDIGNRFNFNATRFINIDRIDYFEPIKSFLVDKTVITGTIIWLKNNKRLYTNTKPNQLMEKLNKGST